MRLAIGGYPAALPTVCGPTAARPAAPWPGALS